MENPLNPEQDAKPVDGAINEPSFVNEVPEDIEDFLSMHGIKEQKYNCYIKKAPLVTGPYRWMPSDFQNNYPSIESIGKQYGPGRYLFSFSWRATDPEKGKKVTRMKEFKVELGEEWQRVANKYNAELLLKEQEELRTLKKQKQYEKAVEGDDFGNSDPFGIDSLLKTKGILHQLGVPMGGTNVPATNADNNDSLWKIILAMNNENAKRAQEYNMMMMKMNTQSQQNMITLIAAMMKSQVPQSNTEMMKEMFTMMREAKILQGELNPEKEGMVDKVFKLLQSMAPALLQLAQKPRQQIQQDPLYKTATATSEFQQLASDPAMLAELCRRWDEAHGPEQTDIILKSAGLTRPEGMNPQYSEPKEPEPNVEEPEIVDDVGDPAPEEDTTAIN